MGENTMKLKKMIEESSRIVFFGGAGVSTESGIPDFRSKDGLYNQKYKYDPEYMLSRNCLMGQPKLFWEFYREKILIKGAKPNDAHKALAKLEQDGKLTAVVTQNIDNLHELAGSKTVYHIHGTITMNHCDQCKQKYTPEEVENAEKDTGLHTKGITEIAGVPRCPCGGVIRPDVTLYGEKLPEKAWVKSCSTVKDADMLIVAGTSLSVYPAATILNYFSGEYLVVINRDPTDRDKWADLVIRDNIGKVLKEALLA